MFDHFGLATGEEDESGERGNILAAQLLERDLEFHPVVAVAVGGAVADDSQRAHIEFCMGAGEDHGEPA